MIKNSVKNLFALVFLVLVVLFICLMGYLSIAAPPAACEGGPCPIDGRAPQ